ncbi:MAG: MotA/TolQ/ExbB proton channel family protein [Pseudomonadales bacterium]|nr:MotA/TolQ/ExbB proton channel family protein [Pseudomonadales bacterium]
MNLSKRWAHRLLLLCFVVLPLASLTSGNLSADHGADPKQTMRQLLEQIRTGRVNEDRVNREREAAFIARKNQQQTLLEQLEQQLDEANTLSQQLEADFNSNEASLTAQEQQLHERLGDLGELFGVVRQISADTSAQLEQSMVSTQLPDRANLLANIANSRDLPTITDIEKLWFILMEEMHEQGRVVTFDAGIVNTQGIESQQAVTRIGPFVSFTSQGKFLRYLSATGQLSELPRQPRMIYQSAAENLSNASSAGDEQAFVIAPVDPSSGAILSLLIQRPDIIERIQQGGIIGYIVIFIGFIGVLLGVERIISLSVIFYRINQQASQPQTIGNNPLGRIFKAFGAAQQNPADNNSIESLELKLDDLILKEVPAIRRRLSTLKVLAGVAPLLGLLGTVTGMVETFDVITLFGSGDAKLMAGGISQALVTTALGLTVAIPILLLHSIANSRSRHIIECLEEQTAGLLAQYSERRSTTHNSKHNTDD